MDSEFSVQTKVNVNVQLSAGVGISEAIDEMFAKRVGGNKCLASDSPGFRSKPTLWGHRDDRLPGKPFLMVSRDSVNGVAFGHEHSRLMESRLNRFRRS